MSHCKQKTILENIEENIRKIRIPPQWHDQQSILRTINITKRSLFQSQLPIIPNIHNFYSLHFKAVILQRFIRPFFRNAQLPLKPPVFEKPLKPWHFRRNTPLWTTENQAETVAASYYSLSLAGNHPCSLCRRPRVNSFPKQSSEDDNTRRRFRSFQPCVHVAPRPFTGVVVVSFHLSRTQYLTNLWKAPRLRVARDVWIPSFF